MQNFYLVLSLTAITDGPLELGLCILHENRIKLFLQMIYKLLFLSKLIQTLLWHETIRL